MTCKRKIVTTERTGNLYFDTLECGHFIEHAGSSSYYRHCWKCAVGHPPIGDLDAIIKMAKGEA